MFKIPDSDKREWLKIMQDVRAKAKNKGLTDPVRLTYALELLLKENEELRRQIDENSN